MCSWACMFDGPWLPLTYLKPYMLLHHQLLPLVTWSCVHPYPNLAGLPCLFLNLCCQLWLWPNLFSCLLFQYLLCSLDTNPGHVLTPFFTVLLLPDCCCSVHLTTLLGSCICLLSTCSRQFRINYQGILKWISYNQPCHFAPCYTQSSSPSETGQGGIRAALLSTLP